MDNELDNDTYLGWCNWHTWNADLWLTGNDYSLYLTAIEVQDPDQLKDLFVDTYGHSHDDIAVGLVDWDEIFDALQGVE